MVVERGFLPALAGVASIVLNVAAILGGFVVSGLLDRGWRQSVFLAIYLGNAVSLLLLSLLLLNSLVFVSLNAQKITAAAKPEDVAAEKTDKKAARKAAKTEKTEEEAK